MARLERDSVGIYYEVYGEGPAILLTHGFGATSRMWDGQIAELAARHKLILWDMRGHGQSDSPDDLVAYSEEQTVGDMAAVMNAAGATQAIVGGLSLGGYMSLAFHAVYPERVVALILCDTGPGFKKDPPRDAWNDVALGVADGLEREGLSYLSKFSREMVPENHQSASGIANAARGMLTQRDARIISSLPSVAVPTLVVVGEKDTPFLVGCLYLADKIPCAEHALIPNAGHCANMDQPALFNEIVTAFITKVPEDPKNSPDAI